MDTSRNGEEHADLFGNSVLRISHFATDGIHVLKATGAIDLATVRFILDAVAKVVRSRPRRMIVDISEVDFFGTTGYLALLHAKNQMGGELAVVASAGRIAARPLRLIDTDGNLTVFESLPDAFADGVSPV